MDTVVLRCPNCSRESVAERDALDPEEAAVVEIICPGCDRGDFNVPTFWAADGSEILWDGSPSPIAKGERV